MVAELDHLLEFVGGIDMQEGEGKGAGVERFLRQTDHHRGVLADGVEHHWPLEFGGDFSYDVNAFGFQGA